MSAPLLQVSNLVVDFSGFKAIGERFGPFDLTLVETGAYNEDWADIHMLPEQSLQAHLQRQDYAGHIYLD